MVSKFQTDFQKHSTIQIINTFNKTIKEICLLLNLILTTKDLSARTELELN